MARVDGTLWPASTTTDFRVRIDLSEADGWLFPASGHDFRVRTYAGPIIVVSGGGGGFPTQFDGLRTFYGGVVKSLCLVAVADAPSGMGGQLFIDKNGTTFCIYLVETTDPNASSVRIRTTSGTKAIRLKT